MSSIAICQIIFGFSIFGLLFIFSRNLPLIPDYEVKYVPKEKRVSFRLRRNVTEGKIKTSHKAHKFQEKITSRLRVVVLKIDNYLSSRLQKVRERRFHLENIYFKKHKIEKKTKDKKEDKKGV
ncbi:MAG: hypothetical protein PHI88_01335 [Candidatus Pacebacteria bacterium]|nr:hypothetical protein [Candidatus Paceibacterota bacterium]